MIKNKRKKLGTLIASLSLVGTIIISVVAVLIVNANSFKFNRNEIVYTSLPTMFINLYDNNEKTYSLDKVNKEDYVSSTITINNTEECYCFEGSAEFKGRGNGSWSAEKKGWKIKLKNKASLFGRPANKHWVLLACANFEDKTMYRNYLAYNMASTIFEGIEYTTTANWIDVYINGLYQGVYVICEHVRVGDGRVDIKSKYGVLDTGYLIEYDAYASGTEGIDYFCIEGVKYPFTVASPDPEEYLEEGLTEEEFRAQVNYIKNYVQSVYNAGLNKDFSTFSSLVDIDSFVDIYILQELFKNTDAGYSSFYLYKKPGKKLFAGPAWDFDGTTVAARGDSSPNGIYVADKVQQFSPSTANELLISLYNTSEFKNLIVARWQQLSPQIQNFINEQMNEDVYNEISEAMARNLSLWYKKPVEKAKAMWNVEVKALKKWFDERINFLNLEWI